MGSLLPSNTYAGKDIDLWQPAGDNQTITGNLTVIGTTECDAAVSCKNTLDVTNEITAGSITVAEGVITGSILAATQALGVTGNATIQDSLTVGAINCGGDISITNGNLDVINTDPTATTTGNVSGRNGLRYGIAKQVFANDVYWDGTEVIEWSITSHNQSYATTASFALPVDFITNNSRYTPKKIATIIVGPPTNGPVPTGFTVYFYSLSDPGNLFKYVIPGTWTDSLHIDAYSIGPSNTPSGDPLGIIVDWWYSNLGTLTVVPQNPPA